MVKTLLLLLLFTNGYVNAYADKAYSGAIVGELDDSKLVVKGDTCNKNVGSITGLKGNNNLNYEWKNAKGISFGSSLDQKGLPGGQYTLIYTNAVTKLATTYGPITVPAFNGPVIDKTNLKVTPSACGKNDGTITGLKITGAGKLQVFWTVNYSRGVYFLGADVINAPPGTYTLLAVDESCATSSIVVVIASTSGVINLDDTKMVVNPENCVGQDGSITGLTINNPLPNQALSWKDDLGKVWSTSLDAINLPAGYYTLSLMYDNLSCPKTYGPIHIKRDGGPLIDESKSVVLPADCNGDDGGITRLTATGKGRLSYEWINELNNVVSSQLELRNVTYGRYMLKVTDDASICGPTYSRPYYLGGILPSKALLDVSHVVVTKTVCNMLGSVTGLIVYGTGNYYWEDDKGITVSKDFDLMDATGGIYEFHYKDPCGDEKIVKYDLGPAKVKMPEQHVKIENICGFNAEGSLETDAKLYVTGYRWVNSAGVTVGTTAKVSGLPAGEYTLYVTDYVGCDDTYGPYSVKVVPTPIITLGSGTITNDKCFTKTGGIKDVKISGGTLPYNLAWIDAAGDTVGVTQDITSLGAGTYSLILKDGGGCRVISPDTYTISNISSDVPALHLSNINSCSPGDVVINAGPAKDHYSFRLYESEDSEIPIAEKANGKFSVNVTGTRTFYISQLYGVCEGARSPVTITTGLSPIIANAFSPNGDGINDYWKIIGIDLFPKTSVIVFARNGEKVFESVGYATPFDGTFNGRALSSGTYYYIINLNTGCGLRSGNLTIIR